MRGAEAVIRRTKHGYVKERVPKGYRHPEIDRTLRKARTGVEARLLGKARKAGVPVPDVTVVGDATLLIAPVEGILVKDALDKAPGIAARIGAHVARLHAAGIIHGDLTTSNMLLAGNEIVLIDFGLGYHSVRLEDKAVDLHVFLQALESRHHRVADRAWRAFRKGYAPSQELLARLAKVRARGRNKCDS